MKDAYSFDIDEAAARLSYNRMFVAYLRTFARMGLKAIPMRAETGPIGGDLSHEFIVLAETGESGVFCNRDVLDLPVPGADVDYNGDLSPIIKQWTDLYAATEDVHDPARYESEVPADKRVQTRGIEVGQIFYFGTKYSDTMKALVSGPDGAEKPVHGAPMASACRVWWGRSSRPAMTKTASSGRKRWRRSASPSSISSRTAQRPIAACEKLYAALTTKGVDVLYDDTDQRPGGKFATADLIGIPWQILIGPKGLVEGKVEIKRRSDGSRDFMSLDDAINRFAI